MDALSSTSYIGMDLLLIILLILMPWRLDHRKLVFDEEADVVHTLTSWCFRYLGPLSNIPLGFRTCLVIYLSLATCFARHLRSLSTQMFHDMLRPLFHSHLDPRGPFLEPKAEIIFKRSVQSMDIRFRPRNSGSQSSTRSPDLSLPLSLGLKVLSSLNATGTKSRSRPCSSLHDERILSLSKSDSLLASKSKHLSSKYRVIYPVKWSQQ